MDTSKRMSYNDIEKLINETLDKPKNVLEELNGYADFLIDMHNQNNDFIAEYPNVRFELKQGMMDQLRQTMSFPILHFVKSQVLLMIEIAEPNDNEFTVDRLNVAKELIDFLIMATNQD